MLVRDDANFHLCFEKQDAGRTGVRDLPFGDSAPGSLYQVLSRSGLCTSGRREKKEGFSLKYI